MTPSIYTFQSHSFERKVPKIYKFKSTVHYTIWLQKKWHFPGVSCVWWNCHQFQKVTLFMGAERGRFVRILNPYSVQWAEYKAIRVFVIWCNSSVHKCIPIVNKLSRGLPYKTTAKASFKACRVKFCFLTTQHFSWVGYVSTEKALLE